MVVLTILLYSVKSFFITLRSLGYNPLPAKYRENSAIRKTATRPAAATFPKICVLQFRT